MSSPQQGYSFPEDNCRGIINVEDVETSSSALANIAAPENETLPTTSPISDATQSGLIWKCVEINFLLFIFIRIWFILTKSLNNQQI